MRSPLEEWEGLRNWICSSVKNKKKKTEKWFSLIRWCGESADLKRGFLDIRLDFWISRLIVLMFLFQSSRWFMSGRCSGIFLHEVLFFFPCYDSPTLSMHADIGDSRIATASTSEVVKPARNKSTNKHAASTLKALKAQYPAVV